MRFAPLALVLLGGTAAAAPVVFPADSAFTPMRCGNTPAFDAYRDEPGFLDDTDLVGTATGPAALRASNATYLFVRIRLDGDPAPNQAPLASSWGMELDLDGDPTTYELLMLVDGTTSAVELFTNHTATLANDPNDPADQPAVATYTFANNARSAPAPMPDTGGNADFFLDFAIPWTDLIAAGLDHATATDLWVASSTSADSLNGDFACNDGASGPVHLDGTKSDPTTGDPANDPNTGSGSGSGSGSGEERLEGGGGCSMTCGASSPLIVIAIAALLRRRRVASSRSS